jgi:transposase
MDPSMAISSPPMSSRCSPRPWPRGDVVILDNLASHKGKAARKAIRAKGAHLIFLPPCSPDLNPIEQVFAKLKHMMRKAQPGTVEATWQKVGKLLDLFAPEECTNDLRNSGYAAG